MAFCIPHDVPLMVSAQAHLRGLFFHVSMPWSADSGAATAHQASVRNLKSRHGKTSITVYPKQAIHKTP